MPPRRKRVPQSDEDEDFIVSSDELDTSGSESEDASSSDGEEDYDDSEEEDAPPSKPATRRSARPKESTEAIARRTRRAEALEQITKKRKATKRTTPVRRRGAVRKQSSSEEEELLSLDTSSSEDDEEEVIIVRKKPRITPSRAIKKPKTPSSEDDELPPARRSRQIVRIGVTPQKSTAKKNKLPSPSTSTIDGSSSSEEEEDDQRVERLTFAGPRLQRSKPNHKVNNMLLGFRDYTDNDRMSDSDGDLADFVDDRTSNEVEAAGSDPSSSSEAGDDEQEDDDQAAVEPEPKKVRKVVIESSSSEDDDDVLNEMNNPKPKEPHRRLRKLRKASQQAEEERELQEEAMELLNTARPDKSAAKRAPPVSRNPSLLIDMMRQAQQSLLQLPALTSEGEEEVLSGDSVEEDEENDDAEEDEYEEEVEEEQGGGAASALAHAMQAASPEWRRDAERLGIGQLNKRDLFEVYVEYMMLCYIDPGYADQAERSQEHKDYYDRAVSVIEWDITNARAQVASEAWRSSTKGLVEAVEALPVCDSDWMDDDKQSYTDWEHSGCDACNRRKAHATRIIAFQGHAIEPTGEGEAVRNMNWKDKLQNKTLAKSLKLASPAFNRRRKGEDMTHEGGEMAFWDFQTRLYREQHAQTTTTSKGGDDDEAEDEDEIKPGEFRRIEFYAGRHCSARLMLYHGLFHWKRRLLARLKQELKKELHHRQLTGQTTAPSKVAAAIIENTALIDDLYNSFLRVKELAQKYQMLNSEETRNKWMTALEGMHHMVVDAMHALHENSAGEESSVQWSDMGEDDEEEEEEPQQQQQQQQRREPTPISISSS